MVIGGGGALRRRPRRVKRRSSSSAIRPAGAWPPCALWLPSRCCRWWQSGCRSCQGKRHRSLPPPAHGQRSAQPVPLVIRSGLMMSFVAQLCVMTCSALGTRTAPALAVALALQCVARLRKHRCATARAHHPPRGQARRPGRIRGISAQQCPEAGRHNAREDNVRALAYSRCELRPPGFVVQPACRAVAGRVVTGRGVGVLASPVKWAEGALTIAIPGRLRAGCVWAHPLAAVCSTGRMGGGPSATGCSLSRLDSPPGHATSELNTASSANAQTDSRAPPLPSKLQRQERRRSPVCANPVPAPPWHQGSELGDPRSLPPL
jgi:hypothetical protein